MANRLKLDFDLIRNEFSLMKEREQRTGTVFRDYGYELSPLMLVIDCKTREVVGYTNEGGDLEEDYEKLKKLLKENPIEERFEVPELGLSEASMDKIVDAIYERYIMNKVAAK